MVVGAGEGGGALEDGGVKHYDVDGACIPGNVWQAMFSDRFALFFLAVLVTASA